MKNFKKLTKALLCLALTATLSLSFVGCDISGFLADVSSGLNGIFPMDTDTNTELFMPAPYDAAYLYWLEAQIHYANEDIGLYNSAITLFTAAYSAFQADYHRNHEARITGRFRF